MTVISVFNVSFFYLKLYICLDSGSLTLLRDLWLYHSGIYTTRTLLGNGNVGTHFKGEEEIWALVIWIILSETNKIFFFV